MTEYKAIETIYNGYRFRSRLEARWAVFFDAAGIRYEYEPEGFERDWGGEVYRYLPDFYFPDWNVYGEVKPSLEKLREDEEKLAVMIDFDGPMAKGLLILGQIPLAGESYKRSPSRKSNSIEDEIPGFYFFYNYKGIWLSRCTILKSDSWKKSALLISDNDIDGTGGTELPLKPKGQELRKELYTHGPGIEKDIKVGGLTIRTYIDWDDIYDMIPFKAYEAARQARFEYGETPE